MADYITRKGDNHITFTQTLTDSAGAAVNLTTATGVKFVARPVTATTPTTNLAGTIVTPASGIVSYTPTLADTATAGQYQVTWVVTWGDSTVSTYPVDGYYEMLVEEDLVTASPVGRIVSLGDVKDHLNIAASDKTHDAELLRFIDATTPVVENFTGPIVQRVYQNELYDGGNVMISVRHRPIVQVNQVIEYRGPVAYTLTQVPTPDLGTIYSYTWEPSGRITRRTVGGGIVPFPPGLGQVWVTYIAGQAVTPGNVRLGALELIRVNYQQTQQGGRPQYGTSSGLADEFQGMQMLGYFVPNRVRELLAPNRRHPSVA